MSDRVPDLTVVVTNGVPRRAAPQPPGRVGRYDLGERLGSGGMADVYRGFDATLNRSVALKFLRDCDDDQMERFMREARAQAHVEHPHICKVYESGIADGQPFIAMQFIDGDSLAVAAHHMSLDARVAVMADVAEAVHAAHRVGLVHRDLKPGNIMIEESDDGRRHAYVLDFGLARDQRSTNLTTVGIVMGTPSYMAPEQARGERHKIDRRTDVYGLGATLYELLTHRPPFEGEGSVAVLLKLVQEDPEPPRAIDESIPADLEAIAMKCLEKDPRRRYESARALSEDLRRYLDGEPVAARRLNPLSKMMSRARRHPTMTAILGVAAVAVIGSSTAAIVTSVRSAEVARAAQRFGQEVERIEAMARYSNMLPLHDVEREHKMIRSRMDRIAREQVALGRAAAGPANYALGRGYMALGDFDTGRRRLEEAWRGGYQIPEVAYALGRVIGVQYDAELQEAERLPTKEAREARRKELEHDYRDAALANLRRSSSSGSESPPYAEGLIAFYEKRYDDALLRARTAFARVPWLYEAKQLEGDVLRQKGIHDYNAGRYDDALRNYAAAGEAYALAHSIAPSDSGPLLGDASRWFRVMQIDINRGLDPNEAKQRGIVAAEQAAATNSGVEESYRIRALILLRFGEWQLMQGQPPAALDESIANASRAIAVNPKSARAYSQIGAALFSKARYADTHGLDPMPFYDAAIRNGRRAVDIAPADPQSLINVANALRRKADAMNARGIDATPLLDQSIVYYDRAVAVEPHWANIHNDRSLAFLSRGEWETAQGKDPLKSLAEAAASAERATVENPTLAVAFTNLSNAHYDRGNYQLSRGRDPRAETEAAAAASLHAATINPKLVAAYVNAGEAYLLSAQFAVRMHQNPREWTTRAIEQEQRALAIDANHASAFVSLALAHLCNLRFDHSAESLRDARAAVAKAGALNRNDADTLTLAAEIETEAGSLAAAKMLVAKALAVNPANRDALALREKLAR